jgi:hypothetical protein
MEELLLDLLTEETMLDFIVEEPLSFWDRWWWTGKSDL